MKKNEHITAFYLEALLLIAVFISIILLLTRIFGASRSQSSEARLLTDAVTLAQNAAEAVSAGESPEDVLALLDENGNAALLPDTAGVTARYNMAMEPDPNGPLQLEVFWLQDPGAAGTLVRADILVRYADREEPVYRLETESFKQEVRP